MNIDVQHLQNVHMNFVNFRHVQMQKEQETKDIWQVKMI